MCRKYLFPTSALIGIAVLLLASGNAVAHGGGGGGGHGGGGFGGGGFHGGGFGGGSFHSGGFGGGFHSGSFHAGGIGASGFHAGSIAGNGFHSGSFYGGSRSFGSYSGSHVNHSFAGLGSQPQTVPHFAQGGTMLPGRVGNGEFGINGHTAGLNESQWRHTQPWRDWGRGENWYRGNEFGHDRRDYDDLAFGLGFFPGWYGGYGGLAYDDYGYFDGLPSYYYGTDNGSYGTMVGYAAPTEATVVQDSTPLVAPYTPASEQYASLGEQYAEQAREAFRDGDYRNALRLAGHSAVEMPRDAAVHELMSLALFALKDYRSAALEAHAALALGPPIDWPTLYAYYGNAETYTGQLRALETFVRDNPKKPEGHFLLGYQYTMMGSKDAAKRELAETVAITPADKLAEHLMKQLNHA